MADKITFKKYCDMSSNPGLVSASCINMLGELFYGGGVEPTELDSIEYYFYLCYKYVDMTGKVLVDAKKLKSTYQKYMSEDTTSLKTLVEDCDKEDNINEMISPGKSGVIDVEVFAQTSSYYKYNNGQHEIELAKPSIVPEHYDFDKGTFSEDVTSIQKFKYLGSKNVGTNEFEYVFNTYVTGSTQSEGSSGTKKYYVYEIDTISSGDKIYDTSSDKNQLSHTGNNVTAFTPSITVVSSDSCKTQTCCTIILNERKYIEITWRTNFIKASNATNWYSTAKYKINGDKQSNAAFTDVSKINNDFASFRKVDFKEMVAEHIILEMLR